MSGYEAKQKHKNQGTHICIDNNAIVAIYPSYARAKFAIKELQNSDFDVEKLSIIGRDYHTDEHVLGYYNAGDRMKYWGKLGSFRGGFWGLLFGNAFFLISGVGPLLVAGPLVGWIIGTLEGAVIIGGVSPLGASLYSQGIPENSVLQYEMAIKADKFVVIAHGTAIETTHAWEIINLTKPEAMKEHQLLNLTETYMVGV